MIKEFRSIGGELNVGSIPHGTGICNSVSLGLGFTSNKPTVFTIPDNLELDTISLEKEILELADKFDAGVLNILSKHGLNINNFSSRGV